MKNQSKIRYRTFQLSRMRCSWCSAWCEASAMAFCTATCGWGGEWILNWIFPRTLRGSFSAVSTPIFASKYSLEWRILRHSFPPLRLQNFSQKSSTFFREWKNELKIFRFFRRILHFFCEILMEFCRNFAASSRKCLYCRGNSWFLEWNFCCHLV